jgi:hypothetical protein
MEIALYSKKGYKKTVVAESLLQQKSIFWLPFRIVVLSKEMRNSWVLPPHPYYEHIRMIIWIRFMKNSMYNWKQNKGYPTKEHRDAIRKHGVTKYHRMSFRLLPSNWS